MVKGLNSNDESKVNESLRKADSLINQKDEINTRIGFSKTSIQKYEKNIDYKAPSADLTSLTETKTDQKTFLDILEKDANERFERKKANNIKANQIKDKGNEQFKLKNYEKALEFYNEAISLVKDNTIIYTNRAQALILTGKYNEAITDCDWALRV